jgi:hypothetical protein
VIGSEGIVLLTERVPVHEKIHVIVVSYGVSFTGVLFGGRSGWGGKG